MKYPFEEKKTWQTEICLVYKVLTCRRQCFGPLDTPFPWPWASLAPRPEADNLRVWLKAGWGPEGLWPGWEPWRRGGACGWCLSHSDGLPACVCVGLRSGHLAGEQQQDSCRRQADGTCVTIISWQVGQGELVLVLGRCGSMESEGYVVFDKSLNFSQPVSSASMKQRAQHHLQGPWEANWASTGELVIHLHVLHFN